MTLVNEVLKFAPMATLDQEQRDKLQTDLDRLGITATELARRAGLNPSTLTRFLNKQGHQGHALTFRTMRKIEQALAAMEGGRPGARGMAEDAARPFDVGDAPNRIALAVQALIGKRNACNAWIVKDESLANLSIARGDVLIVDMNETPQTGDIVCAQVYDQPKGEARTVFRLWEPPFLLSGNPDRSLRRPIIVDNTNAVIRGVVIGRLSARFSEPPAAAVA